MQFHISKTEKSDGTLDIITNPALLIGNGVNYLNETEIEHYRNSESLYISWKELLLSSFPNKNQEELKKNQSVDIETLLPGLTYPEIAELSELLLREEKESLGKRYGNDLKENISKKLIDIDHFRKKNNLNLSHKQIIAKCKTYNWPVLSTNYDHLLFSSLNFRKTNVIRFLGKEIEDPYFIDKNGNDIIHDSGSNVPINLYFRNKPFTNEDDIKKEFAVWNIHGSKRFPGSICINNRDYAKLTAKIEESFTNLYSTNNENPWEGRFFWPNIFLNNDLIILGIELGSAETDLRSLLVKRYEHIKKQEKDIKTYFLYTDYDIEHNKFQNGKELFFKTLGITCIKMNPEDIYSLNFINPIN